LTFHEWRTHLRVYHALVLLGEGHDTTYVSHACGWANPSHFISTFAGIVGTTPGRYQANRDHSSLP
jgi:AraC-like DNA-binding protein